MLQPFVWQIPHLLRDTNKFIVKYEGVDIPYNSLLVTLDFDSLYTSIPYEYIRLVVSVTLDRRIVKDTPTYFLMKLLDLILDKNYFKFGEQFFYQVSGVAMGSSMALSIANLFMGLLKEEYILNSNNNLYHKYNMHYLQYIDDLIFVLDDASVIGPFCDWINGIHPSISFSCQSHPNCIPFLDTVVYHELNKLSVRLYKKGTDCNSYLNYRSFHPQSLRANIPFAQFLRLKRNFTKQSDSKESAS